LEEAGRTPIAVTEGSEGAYNETLTKLQSCSNEPGPYDGGAGETGLADELDFGS